MSKVDILFLNNKAMEELGCGDMAAVMHDVERAYTLVEQGDVITPGKLPMRWARPLRTKTSTAVSMPCPATSAASTTWPVSSGSAAAR